jgi:SAM-dependent methyltransferase
VTAAITLDTFRDRLGRLTAAVAARDPDGIDYGLRLAVADTLYRCHDQLRSEARPFDRAAFLARLDDTVTFVERADAVRPAPGMARQTRPPYETYVADLYSRCWAKYDDDAFRRTVAMFEERLRLNGVAPALDGADCLDAGCGSGRYTMALSSAGARRAHGVDLSARATTEAAARARRLGYGASVTFEQRSVIDLPAEWTNRFDFACSNGVVHHTPDPVRGVAELFRVLRPGGRLFIMVYGKGGSFWMLTEFCRALLAPVPLDVADAWLVMRETPVGKIFFCLDHWYTQYQEQITREDCEARLEAAGFTAVQYLPRALIYDASERFERYPDERDLIGSPDMRYLAVKPRD